MKKSRVRTLLLTAVFTLLGFLVMGYHPGIEDDGVYLSAVKADVLPALYPHDSNFFRLQLQATLFDRLIAWSVDISRIPIPWVELIWQLLSLFAILAAAYAVANRLFDDDFANWAGVGLLAAMLTLPVAGTALSIADQHLHPRNIATALILLAVTRIMAGKPLHAVPLLLLAVVMHPIMAGFGISFCVVLALTATKPVHAWLQSGRGSMAAAMPLGWIFERPSPTWREALQMKRYYFLSQWTWYEWLGAVGPLVLFWLLYRWARGQEKIALARFALSLLIYGVFLLAVAAMMLTPPSLVRLTPLQPMRFLHLIYVFLALMAGCLVGKYLVKTSVWRWALFLLATCGGMLGSQRMLFASSPHLEMPWMSPENRWLQAFAWIRDNTPPDAYFALDPHYLEAPGEDAHGFRALAERSALADAVKDTAVVTQVPRLAPIWSRQVHAAGGWSHFERADFERLKGQFGVDWALVVYPAPTGLDCRWHNDSLAVCRIP